MYWKNLLPIYFLDELLSWNKQKAICLKNSYFYVVFTLAFCELNWSFFYRRLNLGISTSNLISKLWKESLFLGSAQKRNTDHGNNNFSTKIISTEESLLTAEFCYESPVSAAILLRLFTGPFSLFFVSICVFILEKIWTKVRPEKISSNNSKLKIFN